MKSIFRLDQFVARLKAKGLKATPQRIAVHEAMMDLIHAGADDVCKWISGRSDTSVTVASVYNILSQLASIGIYKRRLSANNKMYFDVNSASNLHLYDVVNNEYRDIMDQELTDIIEAHFKKRRFRGYKIEGVDIQLVCHPTRKPKES